VELFAVTWDRSPGAVQEWGDRKTASMLYCAAEFFRFVVTGDMRRSMVEILFGDMRKNGHETVM